MRRVCEERRIIPSIDSGEIKMPEGFQGRFLTRTVGIEGQCNQTKPVMILEDIPTGQKRCLEVSRRLVSQGVSPGDQDRTRHQHIVYETGFRLRLLYIFFIYHIWVYASSLLMILNSGCPMTKQMRVLHMFITLVCRVHQFLPAGISPITGTYTHSGGMQQSSCLLADDRVNPTTNCDSLLFLPHCLEVTLPLLPYIPQSWPISLNFTPTTSAL